MAADEKSVRRWSLLAIALLFPAVFIAGAWRDVRDAAREREAFVAGPQAASYGGATLRLSHFRIFADEQDARLAMPKDRALVLVRVKARFEQAAKEDWLLCRLTLVDGAGRIWEPSSFSVPFGMRRFVEPDGKSPESCSSVAISGKAGGEETEFGAAYVLPRDALPTLKVRFSTRGDRPWAVEFAKP